MRKALPRGTPVELWWQDEARVGQKNGITRRWAMRGTRPSAPHDQRTKSAYIFGAICPAQGKGAALVIASLQHPGDDAASRRNLGSRGARRSCGAAARSRSEEHTSELQSLMRISYAVFCLKKKKKKR